MSNEERAPEPDILATPRESLLGAAAPPAVPIFDDPWQLLAHARGIPLDDRRGMADAYLRLAAKKPPLDRDTLIHEGKEVFKYTIGTALETIKREVDIEAGTGKISPAVVTDEVLAEMVYRPAHTPALGYLVHRFDRPEDPPTFAESIEHDGAMFYPPGSSLVASRVVLFPCAVEEYTTNAQLFREITAFIDSYFCVPDSRRSFLAVMGAYVLMTWVSDRFKALGYLRIRGGFGTGKSRLLQVIGSLCYRAMFTGGATTPSPIFRIIERFGGTFVVDEADFGRSDYWDEIVKILCTGYQVGFPVLRTERTADDGFDVRGYATFGPKILATRERFADDALESRCITFDTEVVRDLGERPLVFDDEAEARAQQLRNKLLLWRFRNYQRVKVDPRARPLGDEPRTDQVLQPLLAVVEDPAVREAILAVGRELGRTTLDDRQSSLEGRIVAALARRASTAAACGHWLVADVAADVNAAAPSPAQKPVSAKTVGRRMKNVFRLSRREGEANAAYRYDPGRLGELLSQYGIPAPRVPLR